MRGQLDAVHRDAPPGERQRHPPVSATNSSTGPPSASSQSRSTMGTSTWTADGPRRSCPRPQLLPETR
jgi:hypothetical protein